MSQGVAACKGVMLYTPVREMFHLTGN